MSLMWVRRSWLGDLNRRRGRQSPGLMEGAVVVEVGLAVMLDAGVVDQVVEASEVEVGDAEEVRRSATPTRCRWVVVHGGVVVDTVP